LQEANYDSGENFFFYRNLPIKWVRVVGIVVAVDEFSGRRVYTLDDSSGACIECMVLIPSTGSKIDEQGKGDSGQKSDDANPTPQPEYLNLAVGNVIDVKGGLSIYRDEKQLHIEKVTAVRCTAQEVALWKKRAQFRTEVLAKPWVLRSRDIRRCRKEAEHSEEKAEKRRKRLTAILDSRTAGTESEKPPAEKAKRNPISDKEHPSSSKKSLDLKQILRHGGHGKYDALGL
jgi:hypothetical protein